MTRRSVYSAVLALMCAVPWSSPPASAQSNASETLRQAQLSAGIEAGSSQWLRERSANNSASDPTRNLWKMRLR
jgi:hypothetical protein